MNEYVSECPNSIMLRHNASSYNLPMYFNETTAIGFECSNDPQYYRTTTFEWSVTNSYDGTVHHSQGKDRYLQYYFAEGGDYTVKCKAWFDIPNCRRCENEATVPITLDGTNIT